MVDGKETVTVKRRQVMGEERKGKDEVEECEWWGLYSVTGKDGSWTGDCVAGLLGESTCMGVTTMLIKIMFGPYILIFHKSTSILSIFVSLNIPKNLQVIKSLLIQHGCYQSGLELLPKNQIIRLLDKLTCYQANYFFKTSFILKKSTSC